MNNNNVILLALAVAIIAAVGTYCIVEDGSDDGSSLPDVKTELQPGDFVFADTIIGEKVIETYVVVASNLDGESVGIIVYKDGEPEYVEFDLDELLGRLSVNSGGYTELEEIAEGTELTYMGMRECITYTCVYDGMDGQVMADAETGLVYEVVLDMNGTEMTVDILETSMVNVFGPGPEPDVTDHVDFDVEVGDYVQAIVDVFEGSTGEGAGLTYTVTAVDKEADKLTYNDGEGGSYNTTIAGFYELFINSPEEGTYDRVDVDLCDTAFGDRLCVLYYSGEDLIAAVGLDSGICYYEMAEIDGTVVEVTLFDTTLFEDTLF